MKLTGIVSLISCPLTWLRLVACAGAIGGPALAQTQTLPVPNGSFESPVTSFVDLRIDAWQKYPKPAGFPITDEQWEQGVGMFKNTAPGQPDHIGNIDGNQAIYIFSGPGAGVFLDYNAVDWAGKSNSLAARFEPGRAYAMSVGLIGGGGGMPEGASLLLSFYYRGADNSMITIAAAPVVHSTAAFPTTTNFVDVQVNLPMVNGGDAWAGKRIGVSILSTGPFDKPGGYWDIDNVRLTATVPTLPLANNSFESPVTAFVDLRIDSWQKEPKPVGFPISDEQWEQGVGSFKNTAPGASDHIDNIAGEQAIFIFSGPGAGIFQDFNSIDYAGRSNTPAAMFEVGSSYNLTVGMLGSGGGMPEGATVLLNLYYRDAANAKVTIASVPVVHSAAVFPTNTHFVDFQASVPPVKAADAWANKHIGVEIVSIGPIDKPGGYWDVDNVRLTAGIPSIQLAAKRAGSNLQFSWTSSAGYRYQVRTSQDLLSWSDLGAPLTGTGAPLISVVPLTSPPHAFYTVLVTPVP